MNTPQTKSRRTIVRKPKVKDQVLRLSPNSIRAFESCRARYIYTYVILPRIDSNRMQELTRTGKLFHEIAAIDLEEKKTDSIFHFESRVTREELRELASVLSARDYFQLPAIKEARMEVPIPGGTLQGIADRICMQEDGFLIVDYKTSRYPQWNEDKKQVLAYSYLLNRSQNVHADKITLAVDYIRLNTVNRFTVDASDLEHYEQYLTSVFADVKKLRDEFLKSRDIKAVPHTPDICTGCPALGICPAYRLTVNPSIDTREPATIPTRQLVEELAEREMIAKRFDERIKVIKAALLARHEAGDKEVEEFYKIVTGSATTYPAKQVVVVILNDIIKEVIKAAADRFIVDDAALKNSITSILLQILPENLSPNNIPTEYAEALLPFRTVSAKAPYLRNKRS